MFLGQILKKNNKFCRLKKKKKEKSENRHPVYFNELPTSADIMIKLITKHDII